MERQASRLQDLSSLQPGIQPMLPALEVQVCAGLKSLNQKITIQWMVFVCFAVLSIFKLTSDRRMEPGWLSMGHNLAQLNSSKRMGLLEFMRDQMILKSEQVGSMVITLAVCPQGPFTALASQGLVTSYGTK